MPRCQSRPVSAAAAMSDTVLVRHKRIPQNGTARIPASQFDEAVHEKVPEEDAVPETAVEDESKPRKRPWAR